jgi:aryl-alcohol dehydrogenase-like predicted oxidoreductase
MSIETIGARVKSEFQEPRLSRNLKLVEVLQHIGQQHDRSPGEVAIACNTARFVNIRRLG